MTETTMIRAKAQQMWQELDGECVVLDLETGTYYGLDEVGTRVWKSVQDPCSVRRLRETMLAEYDVDPVRCARDLDGLLEALRERGLIQIEEAPAMEHAGAGARASGFGEERR